MDIDTDKDTACAMASDKSFVCALNQHIMAYGTAYVFGYMYMQKAAHFPPFFPSISHGTSLFETIAGCLFEGRRSAAVIIRTLVVESNIISDQFYELLRVLLHEFGS